jgi:hypothetical protein
VIGDVFDLVLRPDTPPGRYELWTGMYELRTMQRQPVVLEGAFASDRVPLGQIEVVPAPAGG